jgi:hypothetical protein
MMHKRHFILLVVLALVAPMAQADTIHLKNGSVLKGKVASFADDQFIIMLDTGSGRYLSRAMVFVGDVARIEFENAPAGASDSAIRDSSPAPRAEEAAPLRDTPSRRASDPAARDLPAGEGDTGHVTAAPQTVEKSTKPEANRDSARATILPDAPRNALPEPQPRATDTAESQPAHQPESAQPEKPQPEKPVESKPGRSFDRPADADKSAATAPVETAPEVERPTARKAAGPGRTATIDVIGKRDWTSTGLIVKRGDRIRVNASGAVTIDPVTGRTSGPEGTGELTDTKKLMADQPTGALIGVIGADNDDFIFIGKSSEFTATRDGLLFLSVNEGNLADNVGSFKAIIEVLSQKNRDK